MAFKIASSPFTHNHQRIMLWVILACVPGIVAQTLFFGVSTLIQIALLSVTALTAEAVTLSLRKFAVRTTLSDQSAPLTAILLGGSLPPLGTLVDGGACHLFRYRDRQATLWWLRKQPV